MNEKQLFEMIGTHFVGMLCVAEANRNNTGEKIRRQTFILPGVVVEAEGLWFFVTAKHWFDDIDTLESTGYQLKICRIIDQFSPSATHSEGIPIAYDSILKIKIESNDKSDFDVAAFYLPNHVKNLLTQNGIRAMSETTWENPPSKCDTYLLCGLPNPLKRFEVSDSFELPQLSAFECLAIKVDSLDSPPDRFQKNPEHYFYGQLPKRFVNQHGREMADDIEGMSGGPVFGFKKIEERERYWLLGIQSSWLKDSHEIAAASAQIAGISLANGIRSLLREFKENAALTSA